MVAAGKSRAEHGALAVPEFEQVVAVHRQVGEPVRAVTVHLEEPLQEGEVLELPLLDVLGVQVCPLMEQQATSPVVSVRGEKPARVQPVDRRVEPERVAGDEPADLVAEGVRVAETSHDSRGEAGADPRVVGRARPIGIGLPEVVEQRAEAHAQLGAEVGRFLDDREEVLLERSRLPRGAEIVPDHRYVLRQELDESAGVPPDTERLRGPGSEQELRPLPHPVRGQPSPDPLPRHVP